MKHIRPWQKENQTYPPLAERESNISAPVRKIIKHIRPWQKENQTYPPLAER